MNINFQKLMRVLPSLITVFVIVAMCAVPGFAAVLDFNDYITNESVSGDNTIVTVSIPLDVLSVQWRLWNRTNGSWPLLKDYTGLSFTHTYSSSIDYALTINPFLTDSIDVRDIPDGTVLTFSYIASGVGYSGDSGIPARIGLTYLDENGNSLGYVNGAFYNGQFLEDNAVPFTLSKPAGTVSIRPSLTFDDFKPIGNVTATISLTGVSFQFSIDSLLRLQQETGRTNKLLDEIKEQMNINNQNWQDFLDGKKEWQDIVDSSTDKVEDAVDDMNGVSDSLATVPKPDIDIDTLVPDELAGQEYLNYINVLQQIWSNPLISTVTYIMGCMLIISYLLFGERG